MGFGTQVWKPEAEPVSWTLAAEGAPQQRHFVRGVYGPVQGSSLCTGQSIWVETISQSENFKYYMADVF